MELDLVTQDKLTVCYEDSKKDIPCLVVFRESKTGIQMVGGFHGDKAKGIYQSLFNDESKYD